MPSEVSVAASFFSRFEGEPKIYAAYVTFDPKHPGARVEAAQWMKEEYVEKLCKGRVLTDFDQRAPLFFDTLFSLDQGMTTPSLAAKIGTLSEIYGNFDWTQLNRVIYSEGEVIVTSNTYNIQNSQHLVINSHLEGTSLTVNNIPMPMRIRRGSSRNGWNNLPRHWGRLPKRNRRRRQWQWQYKPRPWSVKLQN